MKIGPIREQEFIFWIFVIFTTIRRRFGVNRREIPRKIESIRLNPQEVDTKVNSDTCELHVFPALGQLALHSYLQQLCRQTAMHLRAHRLLNLWKLFVVAGVGRI
jgi:hypothetical protein